MNFICNFPILFFLHTFGCGSDPILERAYELEKQDISEKQKPVKPIKPPEVTPPKNPPAVLPTVAPPKEIPKDRVDPPPKNPKDGPFITIKGTVGVEKWSGKQIKIDIFDGDQRKIGGTRPSVIVSEVVNTVGSFEIDLPKSDKQLWIGASIDEDGDGRPGPSDPSGWYQSNPISGQENHRGINLVLDVPDDPSQK
jgi:hypothetical protein